MKTVFYVTNALDDQTRLERGITTDSPAASRKVFNISHSLKISGIRPVIISMGRGRQDGSWRFFPGKLKRVNGLVVVYLPFLKAPILSEVLTLLALTAMLPLIRRFRGAHEEKAILFYNRAPAYFIGLALTRLAGYRTFLDLEDGNFGTGNLSISTLKTHTLKLFFDVCFSSGAVLACSGLRWGTRVRPTICCYGTTKSVARKPAFARPIRVLLGGTISREYGVLTLVDAIRSMRKLAPNWASDFQFDITGKGDCLSLFQDLASDARPPAVLVHGRMNNEDYRNLLDEINVGLALQPIGGRLAQNTFPSKVIELASHCILVLTTDINDVRKVLADGALYLTENTQDQLVERLKWVTENREQARSMAEVAMNRVDDICSPAKVGYTLARFLFPGPLPKPQ